MRQPNAQLRCVDGQFFTLASPLLDVIVHVDADFLRRFRLEPNNAVVATANTVAIFEQIESSNPSYVVGGCSVNTARALQWRLRHPKICTITGAVGIDSYATIIREQLNREGISYIFNEVREHPTGRCAVLVNGANRSLCTDLGASKCFDIHQLTQEEVWNAVEAASYYYIPGFFFNISAECVMAVAKHATARGKTLALNLSAPFITKEYSDKIYELLPYVDLLFGNEAEVRALALAFNYDNNDLAQILLFVGGVSRKSESITVITRGEQPVCLVHNGNVTEYDVGDIVEVKDTSAAGDAFVGGFLAEFMMTKSLDYCVQSGISVAKNVIQNNGCLFN